MFRLSTYTILGIVFLSSSLFTFVSSDQCIHDHIMESMATHVPHERRQLSTTSKQFYNFTVNEHGRALQSTFSPIRIKLDVSRLYDGGDGTFACNTVGAQYIPTLATRSTDRATCTANDVITEAKRRYLIDVLFPAAVEFYNKALSVRPVTGNLKLPNPMPDYSCFNDGVYFYNLVCCDRNFPQTLRTTGVADSDYYLIVTARPTAGSVLAWATECQSDQYSRPLSGHANISPARMSMLAKDLPNQISVIIHEIGHALGFSSSKYGSFRKPGTLNRVDSLTDVLLTTSDATLGKTVKKIVTPKVIDFVKNHYNCPNWPNAGAEIEDYGGSGTAGSHWEKRLVMNEIMNPVSEPFMYKSGLFLSYFEDSGWYSVDYSVAEKLPWGFNQGCDFVRKKCVDGWSNFYFCRTPNENGCTADMRYQAQCNLDDNPYVTYPANFQYFPGSPGKGGKQPHTDYCPFYQLFSTRDCSDPATIAYFFYGEKPGSGSRCLMGTYQLKTVSAEPAMHGGCLQTTCNSLTNLIEITLTGNPPLVVQCPKDGGNLDLSTISGSQYNGYLMCPPAKQLCTGDPCDVQDCNGHGKCNAADGTCNCDNGYFGPNAYSCSWKTCPSNSNTTMCSGHGTCNKLTGVCEDSNGNAGCFAGWSGTDCSRQGCPKFNNVECAGNGACVSGACVCNAGFIGNDCSLTDCPGTPRCSDPGDYTVGKCDTSIGICNCADGFDNNANPLYFYGIACATNSSGTRPFTELNFVGEFDPSTNGTYAPVTGRLYPKDYAYFSFNVPTTQYPITLTFTALTAGAVSPAPMLSASYASSGRPSALVHDFPTTTTADNGRTTSIRFAAASGDGTSTFSKTGTILISVVISGSTGLSYLDYSIELKRDGCATLECAFGYCSNSRCVCDRLPEASSNYVTYGWSGTLCDEPDCPGTPDCGGKRGSCVVPASAYMSNGSAIPFKYPSCSCSGVFSGPDCSSYSSKADRISGTQTSFVLDGTWSTRVYTDALTSESWVKDDGTGATTLNGTYTGTLPIGGTTNKLLIDPDTLALVGWGLNGTLGLYLRLDFSSTPSADGMLMTQVMVPPTLTDYRDFDIRSWRATEKVQEISTVLSQLTFVNISNGYYGKEVLSYTLRMELSSSCPPSLRGCSGHGTCSLVCECELGWEGIRCDIPVPQLEANIDYETNELTPGDWQYFVFRPSDAPSSQEVTLNLVRTSLSTASWPLLVAAWDSGRYGTSIGKVTAETVFVDYDALIAHNGSQTVTIRRTNTLSQKWLYIGIRNLPTARTSYTGTIGITESSAITMTLCSSSNADVCRDEKCHGRGTYTVVRDIPSCECDYGWNKDTACSSPIFASFSNLLTAAQKVGFLCSVCTNKAVFNRDEMSFFKIPQPLQKGTGLSLDVRPIEGTIVTSNRRRQLSNTTGVTGHPSLLVSASLPRSILDFVYIESGQNANQTITITEASATGSYWAAVYANTPGTFLLAAKRAKIPIPPVETVDNIAALLKWLRTSTAGYVVMGVGGFLMSLVVLSCLCQCCCGRTAQISKIRERFNQLEDEHMKEAEQLERSMIRVASLNPDKLAQTPALAKALERKKSTRLVLENARSSKALLDNSNPMKSNFSTVPTTGGKPVFAVAAPIIQQVPIPNNPRVTVGQGPSVARTSLLIQSMNNNQQQQPLSSYPNDVQNVQQLRAALNAAAHGGNPGVFQGNNPNYHH